MFRRQIFVRKRWGLLILIASIWFVCVGIQRFVVPYIFDNVLNVIKASASTVLWEKNIDCSKK
jgi:rod shape determining protein RodA